MRKGTAMDDWSWLRMSLYAVLAFSLAMWMVTMGWDHSNDLVDVVRIEAAKVRYLITIAVCLAGLAASSPGRADETAISTRCLFNARDRIGQPTAQYQSRIEYSNIVIILYD